MKLLSALSVMNESIGESWNGTGHVTILYNPRTKQFLWEEGTTHTLLALDHKLVPVPPHYDPEDLEDATVIGEIERAGWVRVGFIQDEERCYCSGQSIRTVRAALKDIIPHLNMHIDQWEIASEDHRFLHLDDKQIKRFLNNTLSERREDTGQFQYSADPTAQEFLALLNQHKILRGAYAEGSSFWWPARLCDHSRGVDLLTDNGEDIRYTRGGSQRRATDRQAEVTAFLVAGLEEESLRDADVSEPEHAVRFGPALISAYYQWYLEPKSFVIPNTDFYFLLDGLQRIRVNPQAVPDFRDSEEQL